MIPGSCAIVLGMEPRIILFDLETLPNLKEALKVWPQLSDFPGRTLKATISTIICAGWKVYGEDKTHCINAWDFSRWKNNINDDFSVCKAISDVLMDADAVVTHNGIRFDWKFLQTRLLYNGLDPLPPINHIDTKSLASRYLYNFNNRLGYIGDTYIGERKLEHEGWDLWVKVHQKDPKAMKTMADYCKQDVDLLEKVFVLLKRFSKHIPNHNNYFQGHEKPLCPACGSTRLHNKGYRHTQTKVYRRYKCLDCKKWSRTDAKDKHPRAL